MAYTRIFQLSNLWFRASARYTPCIDIYRSEFYPQSASIREQRYPSAQWYLIFPANVPFINHLGRSQKSDSRKEAALLPLCSSKAPGIFTGDGDGI